MKERQTLESAEPLIHETGFDIHAVENGHAVSLLLIRDLVYLWLDKEGKVAKATTCDRDQTI